MKRGSVSMRAGPAIAALAMASLGSTGGALAQTISLSNAGLPSLDEVRPIYGLPSGSGIRNVRLSVETAFSQVRNVGQPTERDQRSLETTVGVSAELFNHIFAGVSGTISRDSVNSTNLAFGLPMDGTATILGADMVLAYSMSPFFSIGIIGGVGRGSSSYNFTGFPGPAIPEDSSTQRIGGYVQSTQVINDWNFTGTFSVIGTRTETDWGPSNIPQFDSHGSTILLADLNASYVLNEDLTVSGGVTLNHVVSQVIPAAQTGFDNTWFTLNAGLNYEFTDQIDLFARASTWIGNDRTSFARVSIGASYRF